jgi:RHS repeat-associated protein
VESEEHAGGVNKYSFQIGDPKDETNTSIVTDALGSSRSFTSFNTNGVHKIRSSSKHCPSCPNIAGSSFDANGNYAHKTDFNGRRTNYVYDLTRNLETSRTEGLVGSGTATAATRTITTEWHPTIRLPTVTRVFAGATSTGMPLQTTTTSYDESGNVLTRTVEDPSANVSRTWTYAYDGFGRALTEDGPRTDVADVTTYLYYQCNYGGECGQLHTVTNALGHVTTYNTYNAHGQATLITDPNGVQTVLTYDARQRLSVRTVAHGTAEAETTTFEYWPTGLIKKVVQPDGSFLLNTYDDAHRLIRTEDGAGNKVEYVLDGAGNRQVTNTFDPYGTLIRTQRQLYDSLGQLWQVLTASGTDTEATVYSYDQNGNQTTVSAPLGRVTTNAYDELNRLKQTVDPAGGVTTFGYNALGDLSQVSDPRGLVTSYQHNGVGDLKQLVSPDTGTAVYGYDSGGNQLTATNARNAVTSHTYDEANRVSTTSFSVGGAVDQAINFTYDTGTNGKGRLTGASDANHVLTWSYDAQGRVTNKSQTVGSVLKTVAYTFENGHLASILTPSGQSIAYQYDALGHISGIALNGSTLLNNVSYDAFGPTTGWIWGNGMLTVRNFDLDGRIDLVDSAGLSTYSFNADGSIASRLDDADGAYTLAPGTTDVDVSSTSNRLNSTTGVMQRTYSFDAAGNTMGDGGATFTYNFANRMSSATKNGVTGTYTYNALGQRIRKNVGAATTYFVYDEAGHLLGQYDGAGALVEEIVWMGEIPVASIRPAGLGAVSIYYIHTDHLNTPRRLTNPIDNQIVWRWDSDPYGVAPANEDPDGDTLAIAFNLRFPGQFWDSESGLHYNYFRDYDPAVGRYVESDPIGLHGGINTYAYADGNPVAFTDPTGEYVQFGVWAYRAYQAYRASRAAQAAANTAGAAAAAAVAANGVDNARTREAEHAAYKAVCNQSPPPGLDPCSEAKWKRNRNQQCMNMRQAWDDKWQPGRHAKDIDNLKRAIEKLDEWIRSNCC